MRNKLVKLAEELAELPVRGDFDIPLDALRATAAELAECRIGALPPGRLKYYDEMLQGNSGLGNLPA